MQASTPGPAPRGNRRRATAASGCGSAIWRDQVGRAVQVQAAFAGGFAVVGDVEERGIGGAVGLQRGSRLDYDVRRVEDGVVVGVDDLLARGTICNSLVAHAGWKRANASGSAGNRPGRGCPGVQHDDAVVGLRAEFAAQVVDEDLQQPALPQKRGSGCRIRRVRPGAWPRPCCRCCCRARSPGSRRAEDVDARSRWPRPWIPALVAAAEVGEHARHRTAVSVPQECTLRK